jgi:hypothetical protein
LADWVPAKFFPGMMLLIALISVAGHGVFEIGNDTV